MKRNSMQIKELHIRTNDLPGTEYFYHEVLDLPIEEKSELHLLFRLKQSLLHFNFFDNRPSIYHIAFNIPCNGIAEALQWLKNKISIIPIDDSLIADFKNWNAKAFYFFDNNKNIIEFIARDDLKNQSDLPFDASSILSVSEVGIVTKHVEETCLELKNKYGLDYFPKQPPLKDFAALGDDHGLFIVVSENRNWYPTNISSSKHWSRIVFTNRETETSLETSP